MSLSVLLRSLPTTYTPSSLKTLEPASLFACLSLLDSPPATPKIIKWVDNKQVNLLLLF